MATPPEAVDRPGVSGAQLALVVGGLIVLLAVVWFFFLRGGDEEPLAQPTPAPTTVATPTPEPTEEPRRPDRGRVETFELFAAKDPFEPLVLPGGTGAGVAGAGVTTGPTEEEPTETPPGDGGRRAERADGEGGGGERIGGRRVRLIDVFTEDGDERAQVQVDATVYTVDVGETFAENFNLLSISGECATLLFGDDQFTLCEGEEILK